MENKIKKFESAKNEIVEISKLANNLTLIDNAGAAFEAVIVVDKLRSLLTDEIMKSVFMPLMNTKIGFLTDKPTKSQPTINYSVKDVRDCVIDALSFGLLPTFNQFNIIAGKTYPTKEGYTYLLKKLGVKYYISFGFDNSTKPNFAEIPCKISFEYSGEKKDFSITAVVKKDNYSSYDQLKGKSERRAKKALYEYITGLDLGESGDTMDIEHEDVSTPNPLDFERQQLKTEPNESGKLL